MRFEATMEQEVKLRGCGIRQPDAFYLCCPTAEDGQPVEFFLIDPPIPFEQDAFRAPILFERDGVTHAAIWIGAEFYPFVPDYIEEVRYKGASRRVPRTFDFSRLSGDSKMIMVHPKALCGNWNGTAYPGLQCPSYHPEVREQHNAQEAFCTGMTYYLAPGEDGGRTIADVRYAVHAPSKEISPKWTTGMFLALPVVSVEYVQREDGSIDEEGVAHAQKGGVPVNVVAE